MSDVVSRKTDPFWSNILVSKDIRCNHFAEDVKINFEKIYVFFDCLQRFLRS